VKSRRLPPADPHEDRESQEDQAGDRGTHVHSSERFERRHAREEERHPIPFDLAVEEKEENPVDRRDEEGAVAHDRGERVEFEPDWIDRRFHHRYDAPVRRRDELNEEHQRQHEDSSGANSLTHLEVEID